jgi:hypothetical protein
MVSVYMRIDHVADDHGVVLGKLSVGLRIALRIDDGAQSQRWTAHEVGGTGTVFVK